MSTDVTKHNPPPYKKIGKRRNKRRAQAAAGLLATAAMAMTLITPPSAIAGTGGGGTGAGAGAVGGAARYFDLAIYDDLQRAKSGKPGQGWGVDSINYFISAFRTKATGRRPFVGGGLEQLREKATSTCRAALAEAISATPGANYARVIMLGVSYDTRDGAHYAPWGTTYDSFYNDFYSAFKGTNGYSPGWPNLHGWPTSGSGPMGKARDKFIQRIPKSNPQVVCVAQSDAQDRKIGTPSPPKPPKPTPTPTPTPTPPPPDPEPTPPLPYYDLRVSTDKASVFDKAGSKTPTNDSIHTSAQFLDPAGTMSERVSGSINLKWIGPEDQEKVATKSLRLPNRGTTTSPNFIPSDFGWSSWPSGKMSFSVSVPENENMTNSITTPYLDPRETWTVTSSDPVKEIYRAGTDQRLGANDKLAAGMQYDAKIVAHSNGYKSKMTIYDVINTEDVFIGSQDADNSSAVKVLDPDGNAVPNAEINITRNGGKVVVEGSVSNIENQGNYTLVVPTFTKANLKDYRIDDDSKVCYTASKDHCLDGNSKTTNKVTPNPDKVWVLDKDGALQTADKARTNKQGADEKTFMPGSTVYAVANDYIPANLADKFSAYEITDVWTKASKYVDFSDAKLASVYFDGNDVTSEFTITVDGTKTKAVAKPAFLERTKGLSSETPLKLVIGGAFRTDYDTKGQSVKLLNEGYVRWNNEQKETNVPPVFTETPNPDKVWTLDEAGALVATDPDKTNKQGADEKTFVPGSAVSAVVNGHIPAGLAKAPTEYSLYDDWSGIAKYIDFSNTANVKVMDGDTDVTSKFTISVNGSKTTATANAEFLQSMANRSAKSATKLIVNGSFKDDYDTNGKQVKLINKGGEVWNGGGTAINTPTNEPPVFTRTPKPNKVWALDANGALVTNDPEFTNSKGADGKTFLQGDPVYATVVGTIAKDLARPLKSYEIADNWTKAAKYVNFNDPSKVQVFDGEKDVTDQFTITINENVTKAVAKDEFLATTVGRTAESNIHLIIGGQFRNDYDTDSKVVTLLNDGYEIWDGKKVETNEPPVFTWTPKPHKRVEGSALESGNKTGQDIQGTGVWPGQIIDYAIDVDVNMPTDAAHGIKTLSINDTYDALVIPDMRSVVITDNRTGKVVPNTAYTIKEDREHHMFTVTFNKEWIDANLKGKTKNDGKGILNIKFSARVKDDAIGGSTVTNEAAQVLNGVSKKTEKPTVNIPKLKPRKEDLSTDLTDINKKTVVTGDSILYRLTLDGGPSRDLLAYNVHKLGMVDDFDEAYLDLSTKDIQVKEQETGNDVTDQFNVSIEDGVAYIFAKVSGDKQPSSLKDYDAAPIKPESDPIINQDLLGKKYWVTLRTTVKKAKDGYVIKNQARENLQNNNHRTEIVSNPLKDIDPKKDVVIESGDSKSANNSEIKLYSTFNYRLQSSEIPADRAYAAKSWLIEDTFDKVHDDYTGVWAAYADSDIYQGEKLLHKKGDRIDGSSESSDYFKATFDKDANTFRIEATKKFLDIVNTRSDLAQAFSVYTKMERIAPAEKVLNHIDETYNGKKRTSNEVVTSTPEHPAIDVEKYTLSEGWEQGAKGDHDTMDDPYLMTPKTNKDVQIAFKVTNTGDVPLTNLSLQDKTINETAGAVADITCKLPISDEDKAILNAGSKAKAPETLSGKLEDLKKLEIGQSIDCVGTLVDVRPGNKHSDNATVTGSSIFTEKVVKDEDQWHGKVSGKPSIDVEKFTLSEGLKDGDRDNASQALSLTKEQAQNGVKVGFQVTNTGDMPLQNVTLTDQTLKGTTGKVEDIQCEVPADSDKDYTPTGVEKIEIQKAPETKPSKDEAKEDAKDAKANEADAKDKAEGDEAKGAESDLTAAGPTTDKGAKAEKTDAAKAKSVKKPGDKIGTLGAGRTIQCVGTLRNVKADVLHSDRATVTGQTEPGMFFGEDSGLKPDKNGVVTVTDKDDWHAHYGVKTVVVTGLVVEKQNLAIIGAGLATLVLGIAAAVAFPAIKRRKLRQ